VLVACVAGTAAQYQATNSTADAVLEGRPNNSVPCPALPTRVRPAQIHLQPTLIQHQNWVEFSVPRRFAGPYAFCLDDKVLSTGMGELDFRSGMARFHVATHSVDLNWLSRNLDTLRDPDRWELRLQCAENFNCQ
jgi:hypothetical protein